MLTRMQRLQAALCPVRVLHGRLSGRNLKSRSGRSTTVPHISIDRKYKYSEGKICNGFQFERIEYIPDYNLISCNLRHIGTGTELWYLDRKDTNNMFSINLRTTPFDSTGLPHILEHLVLIGSKNFPVRDPFFKMINRSLATYINGMTGPDYTFFPFSTMNEVDFRNLQRVYLDAVFRPNLTHLGFLQEGWRLEHKELHNRESDLVIKGVVYNEMKGAFSENSPLFNQCLLNNLLPDHTYGNIAGGKPLEIPKATYTDLVEFHRKYYHPSNARIFCYGSFDLEKTLEIVDKEYLSHFERIDNSFSCIPPHDRWSQPRNVHIASRLDCMGTSFDRQNQIAIGLLMCDITDIQESFELKVLSELLIRGPNSAFYKSLIEPNFSGGFNKKSTGFSQLYKDTYFVVGLQDVKVEDFKKFNELFDQTVHKIINEGFESQHIESVLHKLELSLKNQSPNFGKTLLMKSTSLWNNDADVVSNLRVSEMIATLRSKLNENKNYLQEKVEKYFVNNTHKLTLTMSPDELYEENFVQAEAEMLKEKVSALNSKDLEDIYENSIKLEALQKSTDNLDILPCLSLNDVKEPPTLPTITMESIGNVPTQLCKVPTNEITYLKCLFNIGGLSRDEIMLVPLFCNVINEMGTTKRDFREFDKLVLSKTAGIEFKPNIVENVKDAKTYRLGLMMTTHALDKNVSDMFSLSEELLLNFKMEDTDRLKMLIGNYFSKISVGVAKCGHLYAQLGCAGLVTDAAQLKTLLSGVDHIDFMKKYVEQNSTEDIREKLKRIGSKVFNKSNMSAAINSSEAFQSTALEHYTKFLESLPTHEEMKKDIDLNMLKPSLKHYVMTIPVNYCAKSFFAVPYLHEDHPALNVLSQLLTAQYLFSVVRERVGAYGASAKIGFDGIFTFFSDRDCHSTKTLEVFDKTYEWLQAKSNKLDQQTLFEAKLGVLQLLDMPNAPGNIGIDHFLYNMSQDMFVKYRSRVLSVTVDELRAVIDKYLKEEPKHFGKYILGPASEKMNEEAAELKLNVLS